MPEANHAGISAHAAGAGAVSLTLLYEAFSELNSCGDESDSLFIEHTHYCVRCDLSIDRNATIRNKIHEHLNSEK